MSCSRNSGRSHTLVHARARLRWSSISSRIPRAASKNSSWSLAATSLRPDRAKAEPRGSFTADLMVNCIVSRAAVVSCVLSAKSFSIGTGSFRSLVILIGPLSALLSTALRRFQDFFGGSLAHADAIGDADAGVGVAGQV